MKFGLPGSTIERIQQVFEANSKIDEVFIFGSRAKGNYKEGSDIDLAAKGRHIEFKDILNLSGQLDKLNLPYTIDLLDYTAIKDKDVEEHIDRAGIIFYNRWQETEFGSILSQWDIKEIKDLKSKDKSAIAMGPFGSNIKAENFVASGVPVIRGTNLNYDKYVDGEFVFLTEDKANELKGSNCKAGDIVFTHRGTIGQVGIIPNNKYKRYVISQSGMKLTVDLTLINNEYLFYFFKSKQGQYQLLKTESQVGVPSMSNPLTSLKEIKVPVPKKSEQNAIVEALSSLDDKIDLLQRQNATLEQLAETLFRQWFVEEVDESWETGRLGDILESIESGSRPKGGIDPELKEGIPSIGAENINGIGVYDFSKTKFVKQDFFETMKKGLIKNYDVLIYKDGAYVGRKGMFGNRFPYEICTVNEHVFILRANKRANQFFLYFLLQQNELEQLNTNSAQPGLNQEAMKSLEIILPPFELINQFGIEVRELINKIFQNSAQIYSLSKLRDTILPKLMSGEVRVEIN